MQACIKCATPLPGGAIYCPLCEKKQTAQPSKKGLSHRRQPQKSMSVSYTIAAVMIAIL